MTEQTKQALQKAAIEDTMQSKDYPISTQDAFIHGAEKYLDIIWHDTEKELPEERRNVLATTASPKGRGIMEGGVTMVVDRGMLEADKKGLFKRWAYLSDLLPTDIENR